MPLSGLIDPGKNVNNNLTLTHNLRDLRYRADGTGRDSYVHHANGGIMSHQSPKLALKSDLLTSGRMIAQRTPQHGLGDIAKPIHYRSNGSGRDHYITLTDGGLSHPTKPCDPRITFS